MLGRRLGLRCSKSIGFGHALTSSLFFSSKLSESFPALWSPRARSWDMKKSRYTEEQIAFALKQAETGPPVNSY
ncbi:hypothetical protein NS355_07860 [Sphingomonas yabuuchiae]|uniref:Transposase n=1 Tax=Sphingomonas yabuuchiae TaxID=172044 RepID=A0A147IUK7_9SPHN|nr:hypothetical protein NS355_07860 [Sphingomonas yabuuchiae]